MELLYEVAPPPQPPQPPQPPDSELAEGVVGVGCAADGSGEAGGGLDKALVREYGTKIAALVQLGLVSGLSCFFIELIFLYFLLDLFWLLLFTL